MDTYYVVKKGHNVGIFKTWGECKKSIDGYKNPVFRKFETYEEAKVFYTGKNSNASTTVDKFQDIFKLDDNINVISDDEVLKMKQSLNNIKSSNYSDALNYNVKGWTLIDNEIYIFTDGSSRKSQSPNDFNSGFGVYLGLLCTNIKEQFTDNKTNNQCELMSLDYAFKLIVRYYRELIEMNKVIKIVSDSEYSIKSISVWLSAWKKNNWKTAKGEDVKNRELIESIDASMLRIKLINSKLDASKKIKVKLIHVNSHQPMDRSDRTKFNIWNGNNIADLLACNKI